MADFELLSDIHRTIRDLAERAGQAGDRAEYRRLSELRDRLWPAVQAATGQGPLVFSLDAPGYVAVGRVGEPITRIADPGLPGVGYAWRILLHGEAAGHVLNAADLVGECRQPGNTLRNALNRAATWIEHDGRQPAVAMLLRPPSISVTKSGQIKAGRRAPVCLHDPGVFAACSDDLGT